MKKQTPALTQPPADRKETATASSEAIEASIEDRAAAIPETETANGPGAPGQGPATEVAGGPDGPLARDNDASEDEPALLKPPPSDAPAGPPLPPNAPGKSVSRLPVVLAVLALVAVGVLAWQVFELRGIAADTRQEVAQRLAAGDGAVSEIRALTRQNSESIASLQGRFGALESQVATTEGQAAALEALYQEFSRSRSDRALAEVEQAIAIAAQQLQLAGNFEAALIALQGAEARLAAPEQGHLQELRKALIKDIEDLKLHPQVDVSGLALRLEIILERVDRLPLAYTVELAEKTLAGDSEPGSDVVGGGEDAVARALGYVKALGSELWREVRGMVRLERMDQAEPVLLAPAQSTYLRENLKIRLLTARLALLARDGRTYASDLAQARDWMERFFDMRDDQVRRIVADLRELEQTQVRVDPPSLESTFAALRLAQSRVAAGRIEQGGPDAPASVDNAPRE